MEVLRLRRQFPDRKVYILADDVEAAFRHIDIHSQSVHLLGAKIDEANALVLDLECPFGWTGSLGFYEIFGGVIAHVHGSTIPFADAINSEPFFSYRWVDVNVAVHAPTTLAEAERSLRCAMLQVFGADAINEEKFSGWRSLLGCLRHVATCIRSARPILQLLRHKESQLYRVTSVRVSSSMRKDLRWWWTVLHSPHLNGVHMEYFCNLPPVYVEGFMIASDTGLCVVNRHTNAFVLHGFTAEERALIEEGKSGQPHHFDINYRELVSVGFAVIAWGHSSMSSSNCPTHSRLRQDNNT